MMVFTQSALATGETWCSTKTDDIQVEVYLLNTRGPGSPVLDGQATIKLLKEKSEIKMSYKDMVGWWSLGDDIKMHFLHWANGNDKRDTQLIIDAKYSENNEYSFQGTMKFVGPQGHEFTEVVQCELG